MKGTLIFLIAVACIGAGIALAGWLDREFAARSLVRAAKEERRRTQYVYEPVAHGDVPALPRSALIRHMPEPEGM
jgi:hypothetical protein